MAIKYRIYRAGTLWAGAAGAAQSTADIDAPPFNITGQTAGASNNWTVRAYDTVSALESDDSSPLNVEQTGGGPAWTEGFEGMTATPALGAGGQTGDSGFLVRESIYVGSDSLGISQATGGGAARTGSDWLNLNADDYTGAGFAAFDIVAGSPWGAGTLSFWGKAHAADGAGTIQLRKNNTAIGTSKTNVTPPGTYTEYTFTSLPSFATNDVLTVYFEETTGATWFAWDIDDMSWTED